MRTPQLTAEASLGPALHTYAAVQGGPTAVGGGAVVQAGFLDIFSDVLGKVPCLLSCGVPNALSIATQCGFDPACWLSKAPSAGLDCIRSCLG
ncbi:hypothetical protein [Streptomyces pseudovenezuelae]|uniref:Uncharacterized protein n=1 Tax=Streptomyces pseudovenezuelae TaxID=67350 RepID=A0ABT6LZ23_9ACTN|nr:hypothetical protein [Streptomyces pseudovenezuelae]MDH6221557.1 hypothetical protein [Streptomyces pseudovenezuelae]